jgi:cytoskeletal protein RodZ
VSRRTNIPPYLLDAIERDAFAELPGGLLTRGHLRAFASEVGVDAERLIAEGTPESAAQIDVLDLMRVRFRIVEQEHTNTLQVLLVVACILGVLYVTMRHDTEHTASAKPAQEQAVGASEES